MKHSFFSADSACKSRRKLVPGPFDDTLIVVHSSGGDSILPTFAWMKGENWDGGLLQSGLRVRTWREKDELGMQPKVGLRVEKYRVRRKPAGATYRPYPYDADDGRDAPSTPGKKVVRGGSWYVRPTQAGSAYRWKYAAWRKVFNVGFRPIIEP
jgi:hypothetical protein